MLLELETLQLLSLTLSTTLNDKPTRIAVYELRCFEFEPESDKFLATNRLDRNVLKDNFKFRAVPNPLTPSHHD